jgi:hypothetical protein
LSVVFKTAIMPYLFRFFFVLLFLGVTSAVAKAQSLYYPDSVWQSKKPEALKMNTAILDSAVRFAIANETKTDTDLRIANLKAYVNETGYKIIGAVKPRGKPAGIILKNGYIVVQWGDVNRVDMTFSVTKSYLSTLAGLAVDDRIIKSIDDKVGGVNMG